MTSTNDQSAALPPRTESRRYPQALLYEDTLTGKECLELAGELHQGQVTIAEMKFKSTHQPQWCSEFLPVKNDYMTRAGYIVSLPFGTPSTVGSTGPLLVPDQPYYPDIKEAARDWLPFTVHHGDGDGRHEQIVFLLPQTSAYIANVAALNDDTLTVTIAGSAVAKQQLIIKGAYWEGSSIRQLHAAVVGGKARGIPRQVSRAVCCGSHGTRCDCRSFRFS